MKPYEASVFEALDYLGRERVRDLLVRIALRGFIVEGNLLHGVCLATPILAGGKETVGGRHERLPLRVGLGEDCRQVLLAVNH